VHGETSAGSSCASFAGHDIRHDRHRPPIDPSSLTRWRQRIGEEGVEWLLTKTIEAGRASGTVADKSLERVSVDTTVMEKNIAHPTDARLYEKAREKLVALAAEAGVELRQSYARLAPRLAAKAGRYAHARQFRRMRKALRTLKGYTGRGMRDLRRRLEDIPQGPLRERILDMLVLTSRLLHQQPKDAGKLYSLHEPEVDCISKGKARVRLTSSAPRSASPPPPARASSSACGRCRATPTTATPSPRRSSKSRC
jgi:IS5 family transposase